ncbi:retrotransposon protein, putative, ty1-copia subclass [Tanacetum coccineum]
MEDNFKPAVQHQRRVNPKIHEVIKKEVIKLLDAELIYPIFDNPWVSPVHCVPKKDGMTVIENEDNELIPTRHVPKVHDGHFPRHDRGNNGGLHGRFLGLRGFFLRDGILQPTHNESLEKCKSSISGKMARKPFSHQVERAKDLLGLIHSDVCGPFRTMSRKGASYFITFTDDFSRYGYVYLMKHKHEVFETFKVFQNEIENQLCEKL